MAQMLDTSPNWKQQEVPFSRFGTRKVAWYKVGHYADSAGNGLDMVKFNKIVETIQTKMEIVMVGAPYLSNNWAKFMVAVFEDTANDGENTDSYYVNNKSETLQYALEQLNLGGDGVTVTRMYLAGAPNDDEDGGYYGFSNNNTYQEYDRKADFLADSYTRD
jgi:hypothetical protein